MKHKSGLSRKLLAASMKSAVASTAIIATIGGWVAFGVADSQSQNSNGALGIQLQAPQTLTGAAEDQQIVLQTPANSASASDDEVVPVPTATAPSLVDQQDALATVDQLNGSSATNLAPARIPIARTRSSR